MFSRRLKIFQGQNVRENSSAGVLIVEQSLVIRRVSRLHSGRYSCTAINTEGTGLSNTVQLRVMCKWSPWNPFSLFHTFFKKLIDYIDELQFSRSAGQIRNFFTEWPNKKRPLSDAKLTPFHRYNFVQKLIFQVTMSQIHFQLNGRRIRIDGLLTRRHLLK
jgi:hypothetical protein